jgi:FG-GAP-like repeat/FlgD Ig-like domain
VGIGKVFLRLKRAVIFSGGNPMSIRFGLKVNLKISVAAILLILLYVTAASAEVVFSETLVEDSFAGASHTCFADINGDGELDILASAWTANEIRCWINDGNANFNEEYLIGENFTGARTVAAADLNGDGNVDVLSASGDDNELAWWENDGNYGFTEHVISSEMMGAHTVVAINMDDDQDFDIVLGSWNSGVTVWENDGSANFTLVYSSGADITSTSISVKYIDDDDNLDIVSTGYTEGSIELFLNTGNYTFERSFVETAFGGSHWCDAADFDGDNDVDIVGVAYNTSRLRWFENDGEEVFTMHPIANITGASWVESADFDNDGDADILASGEIANEILWYENDGAGEFTEHLIKDDFTRIMGASIADVDHDGDLDFAAAAVVAAEVVYFQNFHNNAYAFSTYITPKFTAPDENVSITSIILNPEDFNIEVFADIDDGEGDEIISIEMFDDGTHGDGAAEDGVWGVAWTVPDGEFMYDVDIRVLDSETGATSSNAAPSWFTTIGPISINNVVVESADPPLVPGGMAIVQVQLFNSANTATVTDLTAIPTTSDQYITVVSAVEYDYPEIAASESALPTNHFVFMVSGDCPAIYEIPIDLSIKVRGEELWTEPFNVSVGSADVDENRDQIPSHYSLDSCYPNPFNPKVIVPFSVPAKSFININVYDILGREVTTLISGQVGAGNHKVVWDGKNMSGSKVSSGVYYIEMKSDSFHSTQKVIMMK